MDHVSMRTTKKVSNRRMEIRRAESLKRLLSLRLCQGNNNIRNYLPPIRVLLSKKVSTVATTP